MLSHVHAAGDAIANSKANAFSNWGNALANSEANAFSNNGDAIANSEANAFSNHGDAVANSKANAFSNHGDAIANSEANAFSNHGDAVANSEANAVSNHGDAVANSVANAYGRRLNGYSGDPLLTSIKAEVVPDSAEHSLNLQAVFAVWYLPVTSVLPGLSTAAFCPAGMDKYAILGRLL